MNDDNATKSDIRAMKQTILDHITQERRNAENYIDDKLVEVNNKLDAVQSDVNTIASVFGFSRDRQSGKLKRN